MRLLVCGDRNWDDPQRVRQEIEKLSKCWEIEVVISGGARGADTFAKEAARVLDLPFLEFPAQWKIGRAAGPIRNQQMIDEGKPTNALAFHHDLGKSKGTLDMVKKLQRHKIPVRIID